VSVAHAVTLPHGILGEGEPRREALLRPARGQDEVFLLEEGAGLTHAERVSGLLARCLVELGGETPTVQAVRDLTAGDREALLLHLRAATHGTRIACVLDCPDCGERLDLDLDVEGLLLTPYPDALRFHEDRLVTNGTRRHVRFRLPTGADQEAAAREPDAAAGARTLLTRCCPELPETLEAELSRRLAELDPQAEIVVRAACPECGADLAALLDAATVLLGELAGSKETLFREVHTLALHYHWSEHEILALDVPRRRRYLELIADAEPPA
jgi:predicted RNA-binding Zn-ribbon protein involved in translation (DUF1610 family)